MEPPTLRAQSTDSVGGDNLLATHRLSALYPGDHGFDSRIYHKLYQQSNWLGMMVSVIENPEGKLVITNRSPIVIFLQAEADSFRTRAVNLVMMPDNNVCPRQ